MASTQFLAPLAIATLAACGGSPGSPDAAIASDGNLVDAGFGPTCEGACRTTALTAAFGSTTRSLDRAYYGVATMATSATLRVEAYGGAAAGCPTSTSPTPSYTLVLGSMPVPTSGAAVTSPGNLLDFVGDLLGGPLGARASAATITPVAADVCADCVGMPAPSDADGLVALDLAVTFPGGTVTGHLFATHCDELDTQE